MATAHSSAARPTPGSGGAPISVLRMSSSSTGPSAKWDSGSLRCGPRRGTATAGSWTRICCGPAASVLARKVPVERPLAVGGAVQGSEPMGRFFVRAGLTAVALWLVTILVPGVQIVGGEGDVLKRAGVIFVVAVIFGVINAFIKPVVQFISIPLYILTLGLIHIVINALTLWITSWVTEHTTHWGLFIDDFWWTAIWAAIVLSVVSWLLSLVVGSAEKNVRR